MARRVAVAAVALLCVGSAGHAQPPPAPQQSQPPSAASLKQERTVNAPPLSETGKLEYDDFLIEGNVIHATRVRFTLGEYILVGRNLDGDPEKELVVTGNPMLTVRGQNITGDVIRFEPRSKRFRVENPRTMLSPDVLQGKLTRPLHIKGDELFGQRGRPAYGRELELTTCDQDHKHYFLRSRELRYEPGKRITLTNTAVFLFGVKLLTIPSLVIPLDRQPTQQRTGYFPQVGRSQIEGYFVKSALNYVLSDRAPGLLRLDYMEKLGLGTGFDQNWNLQKAAGLFTLYAIPTGGAQKNLSSRLNHRQSIGGGQSFTVDNDFQQNSYLASPQTTNFNTRLGYNRTLGGFNTTLNVARQASDTTGSRTRSYSAAIGQGITFGQNSLQLNADYSRYSSVAGGAGQLTEQLNTRFQFDQRAPNYALQIVANRNVPVGNGTGQSFFSGVEKLPEVSLSNYRFTGGLLSTFPINFSVSAGRYSEATPTQSQQSILRTERAVMGFDLQNEQVRLSPSTDLNLSGGFQQYLYAEGAAQYVIKNNTTLTQRWNKRSGVRFEYTYQRPEGGTPFRFDRLGQFHALNADVGFLDDRKLQLTARVGYDFAGVNFGGFSQPWQSLSANLLYRPNSWLRFQNLFTFDPNTGKMIAITNDLRFRGRNDFQLDIVARFDPSRHKFGNINTFLNVPIGKWWRVIGMFQYNGFLNRFESKNLQIVRDLHCMDLIFTYSENPFGFRQDRQFFLQLRIKGIPFLDQFRFGQAGQSLDTGVGGVY